MKEILFTFIFFLIVISIMAIGYIFKRKTIKGSCGGLDVLGIEKACDCKEPCAIKQEKLARIKLE